PPPPPASLSAPTPRDRSPAMRGTAEAPTKPSVPTAPGVRPLNCFICGSGLDSSGTCPVCGVQWTEGSG
ncbi:MAG: hypothetical protein KGI98_15790, partial [Euryarchaeota archaeon]|nr:hypothetical protein [Euryarchaeota archaeon]